MKLLIPIALSLLFGSLLIGKASGKRPIFISPPLPHLESKQCLNYSTRSPSFIEVTNYPQ